MYNDDFDHEISDRETATRQPFRSTDGIGELIIWMAIAVVFIAAMAGGLYVIF